MARKISASEHTRKVGSRLSGHVEPLTNVLNDSSLMKSVLSLGHQRQSEQASRMAKVDKAVEISYQRGT